MLRNSGAMRRAEGLAHQLALVSGQTFPRSGSTQHLRVAPAAPDDSAGPAAFTADAPYRFEQSKILRNYFQDLLDVLEESDSDIDPDALLAGCGIRREDIAAGSGKLTFDRYFCVLGAVDATGKVPGFGLRLGGRKAPRSFGIYGYALLSSTTYAHFTEVAKRIFRAIYDVMELRGEVRGDQLVLTYEILMTPRDGFVPLMEQVLACGVSLMTSLLPAGVSWNDCEIRFTHARPEWFDLYRQYLPCRVRFNQPLNQLVVPARWMRMEIASGDETIAELCEGQCRRILESKDAHSSLSEKIHRLLLNSRADNMPSISQVAGEFHMAERTLRHQLAMENVTFRDLVVSTRIAIAKRYLQQTRLSIQEIAYLLGYSQAQSFYRVFKKAVGITPEAFRCADCGA